MRYLVTADSYEPFMTNWFEAENNFNAELNMVVYDLNTYTYTTDGKTWHKLNFDHL